ncbi:hypothetical protein AMAG_04991 [Allomyces macrogynus ATCC 38327]|uniref:Uncharacterized protein n=1 Tax=Allomyces macrogynus (strain ATCC 38327) TaxID=578462 RepID=A0A0L0S777_ALLM3|nr:hypothetical protein AMAG_04991 [Allomyces macrogynus ATCC 38327]|eukprot:KNE58179.1 hypothetical protein AMAG_04991 [Allomyces macrogynus ATCC 38327]
MPGLKRSPAVADLTALPADLPLVVPVHVAIHPFGNAAAAKPTQCLHVDSLQSVAQLKHALRALVARTGDNEEDVDIDDPRIVWAVAAPAADPDLWKHARLDSAVDLVAMAPRKLVLDRSHNADAVYEVLSAGDTLVIDVRSEVRGESKSAAEHDMVHDMMHGMLPACLLSS